MFYYTKKAREAVVEHIDELIGKVAHVPGNVLNYTDSVAITRYLGDLQDAIKREQMEEDRRQVH